MIGFKMKEIIIIDDLIDERFSFFYNGMEYRLFKFSKSQKANRPDHLTIELDLIKVRK